MKQLSTFFGQILRKIDIDFLNLGNRQAINETQIDLSNRLGGIVSGLEVSPSQDGLSLVVNAGTFYNGGLFNAQNGLGGGEKGTIYLSQTITSLTPTNLIGGSQSYLLIYVKTIIQNTDPNPNSPNVVYSAKNIQTGENQPVRQYTAGVVVVSNPIVLSEIVNFAGVPLALVQTDTNGKIIPGGVMYSINGIAIRRSYTLGGAIDIVTNKIIDSAVPDLFLTDRMFADNQISATKFADSVITSPKLALYDGSSSNYVASGASVVAGSGVATVHLKDQAVTYVKMNYSGSVSGFSTRNRLVNSSFEFQSSLPVGWTISSGTSFVPDTNVTITTNESKYGFQSAKLIGGFSTVAQNVGIEQIVDFNDNLNGKPISAFVYVKPLSGFNLSISGTTGISAKLDFLQTATGSSIQSVVFDAYSGTSTEWQKLETQKAVIAPGSRMVKLTISGAFDNTVFVDGAYLGMTNLIPEWDASTQEQIANNIDAGSITSGQLPGERIAPGAIKTTHIRNANGSVNPDTLSGIVNEQIRDKTITGAKIADGTITTTQVNFSVAAVPAGSIIMWDDKLSNGAAQVGCPTGYTDITSRFAGRFPLGVNAAGAGSNITLPGKQTLVQATGHVPGNDGLNVNIGGGNHGHGASSSTSQSRGGTSDSSQSGHQHTGDASHSHEEVIPYYTVRFCQKD
jgi:hypothetical protein